jgi:hypothetical protein
MGWDEFVYMEEQGGRAGGHGDGFGFARGRLSSNTPHL